MSMQELSQSISINNNSETGILVLHGFTGTPLTMMPQIDRFNQEKFNIEAPLLKGHGTKWQDMLKLKYIDWVNDAEEALLRLKKSSKNIFITGISMGGTLACYLAEKYPEIKGLVLINHAVFINDWRLFFLPVIKNIIKASYGIANDIKKEGVKEIAYETVTRNATYELLQLIKNVKNNFNKITQPVLIFKSLKDHVIKLKSAEYTLNNIYSEKVEIIWLNNSYHVATLDNDSGLISEKSVQFIKDFDRT